MNNKEHLLKQWILESGYKTVSTFAKDVRLDSTKMSNIFKGIRKLQTHEVDIFAKLLDKTPTEIRKSVGEKIEEKMPSLPICGYVGAADQVIFYENESEIFADEKIQVPFFYYQGSLLEVRGESMLPRYSPGEIIGITKPNNSERIPLSMIGKDVVVCLSDKRLLLKILHQGSSKNKFTLSSLNPNIPPIIDVELMWATTVDFHIPKARYI